MGDRSDLTQRAVVQNQAVESSKLGQGEIDGFLAKAVVCDVAGQVFDLVRVRFFEGPQGLFSSSQKDNIVPGGAGEQVLGYCIADAYFPVSLCFFSPGRNCTA